MSNPPSEAQDHPAQKAELVLASASPRRRLLLALLGLRFRIAEPVVDERPLPGEAPFDTARRLACEKAHAVAAAHDEWVLAADTVVVLGGRVFGKPASAREAAAMLAALRDRWHEVGTAVCARPPRGGPPALGLVRSRVRMRRYQPEEVQASIRRGTPFDKAGGYAIQDETFRPVEALRGCYPNVVGLPLCEVVRLLRATGFPGPLPATSLDSPCPLCFAAGRLQGIGGGWLLEHRE